MGTNDVVDTCSGFYATGGYTGTAAQLALAVTTGGASLTYDVLGAGASAHDAYSAASRGDYMTAALNAASSLPFVPRASGDVVDAAGALVRSQREVASTAANTAGDASHLLRPGPYAGDSIPARGTEQTFTAGERAQINEIGGRTGCHSCGTTDPGTRSGNFVPDHQPVSRLMDPPVPQQLYPQCIACSREQGLLVARIIRNGGPQ